MRVRKLKLTYIRLNSFFVSLLSNFYTLNIHIYFLALIIPITRPGIFMDCIYIIIFFILFIKNRFIKLNIVDALVIIYLIFNLASYLWINLYGFTFSNFLEEVSTSLFPILLYYSAKYIVRFEYKYYRNTLIAILTCMLIGIILYITMPVFYREFLYKYGFSYSNLIVHCRQGLSSYIGRIAGGTLTVYGTIISSKLYLESNNKKYLISFILLCISCLLTAQRSAWIGLIISVCYLIVNILFKKGRVDLFIYFIILIVISIIITNYIGLFEGNQIFEKSLNISNMLSERNYTWAVAIKNINNLFIGNGLGTVGHRALGINANFVTDGYYIKMICEIGIVGFLFFILIIISSIFNAMKNWKLNDISILMIIFILIQCIGSNVLATQIIAPMFWLAIGICSTNRKEYIK